MAIHSISTKENFIFFGSDSEEYNTLKDSAPVSVVDSGINIQYDMKETEEKMEAYGYISENGNLHFKNKNEIKEITSLYKIFLDNSKLSTPCAYFGVPSVEYEKLKAETYCFKPKINNRSRSKKRRGNSRDRNQALSHAETLIHKGEKYKEKIEKLREEKLFKEVEGCTFNPVTN